MGERAERISATGTMAIVLVAEMVFFSLRAPDFLTRANFPAATVQVSVLAVVSVGMTFGAISGALDISIASTMALAGCALSRVAASGRPGWEAVAVALLIGLTVGLVNGVVVVFGRVNPIVATLGMLGIARGLAYIVSGSTFVATQSTVGDAVYAPLQGNILSIPRAFLFALAIVLVGYVLLHKTRFGTYAFAIGADPEAARVAAIPVDRLRIAYLAISGFCAGLAGWVLASEADGVGGNAALGYELIVMTAVILGGAGLAGGTGSMIGTAFAVIVLGLLYNGMALMGAAIFYEFLVPGLFLIGAVWLDSLRSGGYK
jgi:ribose/xylose/arabinose/galactoside ABC-type transport system permease subunit